MTCPPNRVGVAGEYRSADTLRTCERRGTCRAPGGRRGAVLRCRHPGRHGAAAARRFRRRDVPAYRMVIDFGPLGTRRSSGRLTDHYRPEELTGSTVVAVVNLPPRQIGPVRSEVLVLGVYQEHSEPRGAAPAGPSVRPRRSGWLRCPSTRVRTNRARIARRAGRATDQPIPLPARRRVLLPGVRRRVLQHRRGESPGCRGLPVRRGVSAPDATAIDTASTR